MEYEQTTPIGPSVSCNLWLCLQAIKLVGTEKGKKGCTLLSCHAGKRVLKALDETLQREKQINALLTWVPYIYVTETRSFTQWYPRFLLPRWETLIIMFYLYVLTEAYWVPPNPLTSGGWILYPRMLGGSLVRPLDKLFGGWVFFPILMGLPMDRRVHCTTSDMKRHLPWFTGRRRTVLLINIVLLLARVH